jgi:hypothetical protein
VRRGNRDDEDRAVPERRGDRRAGPPSAVVLPHLGRASLPSGPARGGTGPVKANRLNTAHRISLVLRALLEACIVVAFAWWGFVAGGSTAAGILLAAAAPAIAFGLWGLVDFHGAGRLAEPARLLQELVISGLAAVAWYAAGQHALAWMLAALSVVHHALVYATGDRLLGHAQKSGGTRLPA